MEYPSLGWRLTSFIVNKREDLEPAVLWHRNKAPEWETRIVSVTLPFCIRFAPVSASLPDHDMVNWSFGMC